MELGLNLYKKVIEMQTAQKQALLALAAASAALASATQALAASFAGDDAPAKPKAPEKCDATTTSPEGEVRTCTATGEHTEHSFPKPKPAPKPPPAKAPPAPAPKPAPEKPPEPAKPATSDEPIETQCRKAAKAFAEVYGREGLKEVLKKYTEGTLADVAPDKLPELLKDLS